MTFINDDGENFHGEVVLNLENCKSKSLNSSMPITGLRLPTEENEESSGPATSVLKDAISDEIVKNENKNDEEKIESDEE